MIGFLAFLDLKLWL